MHGMKAECWNTRNNFGNTFKPQLPLWPWKISEGHTSEIIKGPVQTNVRTKFGVRQYNVTVVYSASQNFESYHAEILN